MTLPEEFRARAAEVKKDALILLAAPDILTKADKLIGAIVGMVDAKVLEALASVVEYQEQVNNPNPRVARLRAIMQRNDAIRQAAAKGSSTGNWSEFDELVEGEANGVPK